MTGLTPQLFGAQIRTMHPMTAGRTREEQEDEHADPAPTEAPRQEHRPVDRLASGWALFIAVALIYLVSPADSTRSDPAFTPFTAHSLLYERDLDLDEFPTEALVGHPLLIDRPGQPPRTELPTAAELDRIRSGEGVALYDYMPWFPAIFAVPVIGAVDVLSNLGGPNSRDLLVDDDFATWHRLASSLVVAGAAVALRAMALRLLSGPRRRRTYVATGFAGLFALGTSAWSTASRALFQHAPSLLFVTISLYLLTYFVPWARPPVGPRGKGIAASLLGVAVMAAATSRPTNVFVVIIVMVLMLVLDRARSILCVIGAAATAAIWVLLTWLMSGQPVQPYYRASRWGVHGDFLTAGAANWVSPSRGLLLASPFLILAVPGAIRLWRQPRGRALVIASAVSVSGVCIAVSGHGNWWAGHSFGPRFMTEAVPWLMLLSLPAVDGIVPGGERPYDRRWRRPVIGAAAVMVVWSLVYHGIGATSPIAACWNRSPENIDLSWHRVWSVTDSQVARPLKSLFVEGDVRRAWAAC